MRESTEKKADFLVAASIIQLDQNINQAKQGFYSALKLNPNCIKAHFHLGKILAWQRQIDAAKKHFFRVIDLNPNHTQAYIHLGKIFIFQTQPREALKYFQLAQKSNPKSEFIPVYINKVQRQLCDWHNYDTKLKEIINIVDNFLQTKPQYNLNPSNATALSLEQFKGLAKIKATRISQKLIQSKQSLSFKHNKFSSGKLKIGYISPDFRDHPVGRLIHQMFRYHNRNQFEIYAYSTFDIKDHITEIIIDGCDNFTNISCLSTEAAAQKIYEDGIQILIDLAGYTTHNRAEILALQPAPIQVQWLGYPNTMGAKFIQYILADRWLITPEMASYYTEEVIYLTQAFVASPMLIANKTIRRQDFDIPENSFVYCCFNSHYKIEPQVFGIWMDILRAVPQSIIWLSEGDGKNNLIQEAKKQGIDANRLFFATSLPHEQYLARYVLADLYLDTFIYNAGSTACAALWGGVPLLTLAGNTNAGRMGASIAAAVGLEANICHSVEQYREKAIYLANNPQELRKMHYQLKNNSHLALFQVENFVEQLEVKFHNIWSKWVLSLH